MSNFSAFKNREKISENLKKSRREKLVTKKTDLIEYRTFAHEDDIHLPILSEEELKKIKDRIKQKIQSSNRKNGILFAISFVLIIMVLVFLFKKLNIF
jgi:hypothetical protein